MPKSNRSGKATVISKHQLQLVSKGLPDKYSLLAEMLYFSAGRLKNISRTTPIIYKFLYGLVR